MYCGMSCADAHTVMLVSMMKSMDIFLNISGVWLNYLLTLPPLRDPPPLNEDLVDTLRDTELLFNDLTLLLLLRLNEAAELRWLLLYVPKVLSAAAVPDARRNEVLKELPAAVLLVWNGLRNSLPAAADGLL